MSPAGKGKQHTLRLRSISATAANKLDGWPIILASCLSQLTCPLLLPTSIAADAAALHSTRTTHIHSDSPTLTEWRVAERKKQNFLIKEIDRPARRAHHDEVWLPIRLD